MAEQALRSIGRRLDDRESIVDALSSLRRQGIAVSDMESTLVRSAPVDLDLLASILGVLRQQMAANEVAPAQPRRSRRIGRFS